MFSGQILRKCLIPAAAVVAEAKKVSSESGSQGSVCRPSELPIYSPEHGCQVKRETEELPGALEGTIREVRTTFAKYSEEISAYKRVATEHLESSRSNMEWLVDYLQKEDNTLPRAGAISIGALAGFIFGLRGGIIKRTLYATAGGTTVAAVCYPGEAAHYTKEGVAEAKKYLTVAYNFIYGVKKDDPPLELPSLPKIPSNVTDMWNSVISVFISDDTSKQVKRCKTDPESSSTTQVQDPLEVITKAHDESVERQCHCPVGACLGHEEGAPVVNAPNENEVENVA